MIGGGNWINIYGVEHCWDPRADGFGEVAIVQRRRVCIPFDDCVMDDLIYLIGGNSRSDVRSCNVKDFSGKLMEGCGSVMSFLKSRRVTNAPDRPFASFPAPPRSRHVAAGQRV
jgi:hypothetical protein